MVTGWGEDRATPPSRRPGYQQPRLDEGESSSGSVEVPPDPRAEFQRPAGQRRTRGGGSPQQWATKESAGEPLLVRRQRRARPRPALDPPVGDAEEVAGTTAPLVLLLSIEEAGHALGVRRTKVYELIRRGDLEVVHIDRSARVPVESVRAYVDRLRTAARDREGWHSRNLPERLRLRSDLGVLPAR